MVSIQSEKIQFEELEFMKIHDRSPLYLSQLRSFDAVIIEYSHWLATKEMIKKIRTQNDESIFLIPIFIHKEYDEGSDSDALADGVLYSLRDLTGIANRTRQIKQRMF